MLYSFKKLPNSFQWGGSCVDLEGEGIQPPPPPPTHVKILNLFIAHRKIIENEPQTPPPLPHPANKIIPRTPLDFFLDRQMR